MFTQFFGNFLLNEQLITAEQLLDGLQEKKNTRLKLGVLAINAGFMNASQVERVHMEQTKKDMRFGDLCVELGFLTNEQVDELLGAQKVGYLLLGQALVDKGYITNAQFEEAINAYKAKFSLSDEDLNDNSNDKITDLIQSLCDFSDSENADLYTQFVELLLNNLVRFIGDDFTPLDPLTYLKSSTDFYQTVQGIEGTLSSETSIIADENVMIQFASRYADEDFDAIDEYVTASACDFLNLHNGLFTVNVSNSKEIELRLTPPFTQKGVRESEKKICVLPICYPFGTVTFTFTM